MDSGIVGWCFLARDRRARKPLQDGSRPALYAGQRLIADNPLDMRHARLHTWIRVIDALQHAHGPYVCRARVSGTIYRADGAVYGTEFSVLWTGDASRILDRFVIDLATRALERERDEGREPDQRFWQAVRAKYALIEGSVSRDKYRHVWRGVLDASSATGTMARTIAQGLRLDTAYDALYPAPIGSTSWLWHVKAATCRALLEEQTGGTPAFLNEELERQFIAASTSPGEEDSGISGASGNEP